MFNKERDKKIHRLEQMVRDLDEDDIKMRNRIRTLEHKNNNLNEDLTTAEVRLNIILQKYDALLNYLNLEVQEQLKSPYVIVKKEKNEKE